MKEKLSVTKFWKRLVDSGDNIHKDSFSARKMSAFVAVITAIWLSAKYCNAEVLDYVITAWLVFALLCLGIITIEEVIRLKNGNPPKEITNEEIKP